MARRYFLTYFIFTHCLVAGQPPQYALKGQKVVLTPDAAGQPDGILWKHDGNKVVEFDGMEQQVYNPYISRITLDWYSAEIHITDLSFKDSGEYELEQDINKRLHRSSYRLEVIDKVDKPTITCEMNNGSSSLVCSAEPRPPQSPLVFEWRSQGKVQPGRTLAISLGEEHDDEVYSCTVKNPLSSEKAEFTAKDCYTDNSSSTALIASLVSIAVLILVGLSILFFKLRHKVSACVAKGDPEKPDITEGSDKMKAHEDEKTPFLDRAPTLPSTQQLRQFNQTIATSHKDTDSDDDTRKEKCPPLSPPIESSFPLDLNNLAGKDKANDNAEQPTEPTKEKVPQYDAEDTEKENEPDAEVSDDLQSDQELYNGPEQQGSKTILSEHDSELSQEPEKEADEDEEAQSAPATAEASPPAQPCSPSTENSPNVAPEDTTDEHKEDANSDQVTGETGEENVKESESSDAGEINESDNLSEDKQWSTVPERKGSETPRKQDLNSSQEETQTEDQQDTVKPVSENENKTNSQGEIEDTDKKEDLQPQSPTPIEPDNRSQESPEKEKSSRESDDSEGQSEKDKSTEDKNEVQGGPQEEKPGTESLSEDKEGLNK